jgi:NAD(P)H-hydrate epimerase
LLIDLLSLPRLLKKNRVNPDNIFPRRIVVKPIGSDEDSRPSKLAERSGQSVRITADFHRFSSLLRTRSMQPRLPPRPPHGHKGTFGHVLILGGCESMPGAPALAGLAALRTGAGLVTVATSREAQPITASFSPALMTTPLPSQSGLVAATREQLEPLLQRADCVAVGPGLGQSPSLQRLLAEVYRNFSGPLVVDADGLNNLAAANIEWSEHVGPRILTPHPGEFRRLVKGPQPAPVEHPHDSSQALEFAVRFARDNQVVLLLKGPATLITDGLQTSFNQTGNSGLATAGSGDVLTGIIAALWAGWLGSATPPPSPPNLQFGGQPNSTAANSPASNASPGGSAEFAFCAAVTAAHLHGLAGELAAQELTETALISSDLPAYLGPAIRRLGGR